MRVPSACPRLPNSLASDWDDGLDWAATQHMYLLYLSTLHMPCMLTETERGREGQFPRNT